MNRQRTRDKEKHSSARYFSTSHHQTLAQHTDNIVTSTSQH